MNNELVTTLDGTSRSLARLVTSATNLRTGDAADKQAFSELLTALASQAAGGHEHALHALLDLTHRFELARPAITRVIVNHTQVDDVAQLVLMKIERSIGNFEGRSAYTTWLHTVARNEALMAIRGDRPTSELEQRDLGEARFSSIVVSRETVNKAIANLEAPYGETLQLQIEGLDYEQIADRLGVPVGTVRSRLAKARDLLSQRLSFAF